MERVKSKEDYYEAGCAKLAKTNKVDIPLDLVYQILLNLPIKALLKHRFVCKKWNALISSQGFAKLLFLRAPVCFLLRTEYQDHVSRTLRLLDGSEIEYNQEVIKLEPIFKLPLRDLNLDREKQTLEVDYIPGLYKFVVVNSFNGLICLSAPDRMNPIIVCNPVTGEFIRVPDPPPWKRPNKTHIHIAFGFQPKTNEYNVLRTWMDNNSGIYGGGVVAEIHTLGTQIWRNLEVDPALRLSFVDLTFPTCVNGALHWISRLRSILCFSFESERFQSFPSPRSVFEKNVGMEDYYEECFSMGELRGLLYICDKSSFLDVAMWVMNEYGNEESWTNVYNIDLRPSPLESNSFFGSCWPVKHFGEGAAILLYHFSGCFVYSEPDKCGFKVFEIRGTESPIVDVIPHIPSLVSLKDVVKGDNVEVLSVHSRCAEFILLEEKEVLSLVYKIDFGSATEDASLCSVKIEEHAS